MNKFFKLKNINNYIIIIENNSFEFLKSIIRFKARI